MNKKLRISYGQLALSIALSVLFCANCVAHHVLGRPAYSLNEDSNTPPSMAVETQIGDYFVTYMVFPAFPRSGEPGRLNLYATRIDNGALFEGDISFFVRDDSWFSAQEELLGTQQIDDGVYRQGFMFKEEGSYIIQARFTAGDEPYLIDFPLQIGKASPIGPLGLAVGALVSILLGANLVQRKRLTRAKVQNAQQQTRTH